jgi:CheY-like chemotaxis protein
MTPRILVADDNPSMLELMAVILDSRGYRVTVVEDGLAAWEEIGRDLPNMVVLDIEMPRLDGCEVCRRMKSQPETNGIPVILISGRQDVADRARLAGADAFLNKPFFLDALEAQIDTLIGANRPLQTALAAN